MGHVDISLRLIQFFILWSLAVLIFTPLALFVMWRKLRVASKRASVAAHSLEALILNDIVTWDLVLGLRKRLGVEELTTDAELQAAMARIVAIAHDIAAWKSETTETLNALCSVHEIQSKRITGVEDRFSTSVQALHARNDVLRDDAALFQKNILALVKRKPGVRSIRKKAKA